MSRLIDLTGQRFGKLIVLQRDKDYICPDGKRHIVRWMCKCDCGNIISAGSRELRFKNTHSCGCNKIDRIIEYNKETKKRYNTYDLAGEYGIGYTSKDEEFYFDLEDYDKIKNYCWRVETNGYVSTGNNKSKKKEYQHHIVLDFQNSFAKGIVIDHKNNNTCDNRKINLRVCSKHNNSKNKKIAKNNTSGVSGVYHKSNKWTSYININKKCTVIGIYNTFDEAVKSRLEAEKRYYGEFSPQKRLWKQYGITDDLLNEKMVVKDDC